MANAPSPLTTLRQAITSSETFPSSIAGKSADRANSNASHNTYLALTTSESRHRAEQLPSFFPDIQNRPPLYGIPISIKDCFDVVGTTTSCGSRYYEHLHPTAAKNSWVAQRLLDAGAIIPGKTNLHQLAYGITGENADYGDCLQPRDASLLTGGSSSGAAASVQEGSALAAIGTDTGGSVRVPAALCGIAGYRASLDVSRGEDRWTGAAHLAPSFDTLGLLFRDLRDGPALANAIYNIPFATAPTQLRIGYVDDEFTNDCEPAVLSSYSSGPTARRSSPPSRPAKPLKSTAATINTSSQQSPSASHGAHPLPQTNSRTFANASIYSAPRCRPSSNASTSSSSRAPLSANSSRAKTNPTSAKRSCAIPRPSASQVFLLSLSQAKLSVPPSALACNWSPPPCRMQFCWPSPRLSRPTTRP